ncbi:MAG: cyclic pyranopterin phosphate synthase MoaA, partial [Prochlorococcaceae cyanobacterium]
LDLRPWLRPDSPAEAVREAIAGRWKHRSDRWSEERQEAWALGNPQGPPAAPAHAEMAYLGG